MRIAYVCADPGVPVFGRKGCSVHVQEVVRALSRLGAGVELFTPGLDGRAPAAFETLRVRRLPDVPKGELSARERASLAANDALRASLEQEGPFDLVYERYSLWSYAAMKYARSAGVPGVLEVNAPLPEEQAAHRGLADPAGARRVAEQVFGDAAVLLAVSREVAAYLERFPGARARVYVVPNGVDPNRFAPGLAPSRPGRPGTWTVGFVGSLKPWHDLAILAETFALLHRRGPDSRLLVVGDGAGRGTLVEGLARHGVGDAAHFTGAVTPDEVPGLLASMDAAIAPYPRRSGFYFSPLKVYEYMAAGLPVVASRVGQISDLIADGVNGLLCPPGDAESLAAALDRLRLAPGLRARLGRAARETVLREHTWDAVARRILDLAGVVPVSRSPLTEVTA
jgi:glycosyltransferase involved in cell wall biosynthesis